MSSYGSPYDYVIHVALIASFQPPLPYFYLRCVKENKQSGRVLARPLAAGFAQFG